MTRFHQRKRLSLTNFRSKPLTIVGICLALGLACTSKSGKSGSGSDVFYSEDGTVASTTGTTFTSTRSWDEGQEFRLGDGYDNLSGERRRTCLDTETPGKAILRGRNLNSMTSDFQVVQSKEDLAKKLNVVVNAEVSGSYGVYSGSASTKNDITKNTSFNERSIVGIMSMVYSAQTMSVDLDEDPLSPTAAALLASDTKRFRQRCGDSYTKSVTTGAALYLVVNMVAKESDTLNKLVSNSSVSASMSTVFSAKVSTDVTKEQTDKLSKFNISVKCYSVGISVDACAQSMTSIDPTDVSTFLSFIATTRSQFAASASGTDRKLLVAIDEHFDNYPKPIAAADKKLSEVFFDVTPQRAIIKDLLSKDNEINYLCNVELYNNCDEVRNDLAKQMEFCARQELWPDCDPSLVDLNKMKANASKGTIGKVVMWEDYLRGRPGKHNIVIDFDKSNSTIKFQENTIYNFSDFGFDNVASGFQSSLAQGYQMRVFEDADGEGKCYMVGSYDTRIFSFGNFNDKASSFRLEKVGAYPSNC